MVQIYTFGDEYEVIAPVMNRSAADLIEGDSKRGFETPRWFAADDDDDTVVAVAQAWERPDERTFLKFFGEPSLVGHLAVAAAADLDVPIFANASDDNLQQFLTVGCDIEFTAESFAVSFDAALASLRRAWLPAGFTVEQADRIDPKALTRLDNELRNDVPGCDGWDADVDWTISELASDTFDPETYLVAVEEHSGDLVALVRIWRNDDGPRFGLIGVRRPYRSTTIGPYLMQQALAAASTWGSTSFVTETSVTNKFIHHRLPRIGAASTGRIYQMVCQPSVQGEAEFDSDY